MVYFGDINALNRASIGNPNLDTASPELDARKRLSEHAIALLSPSVREAGLRQPNPHLILVADTVPVLHGHGRTPLPYKGGIGPNAPLAGRLISNMGPLAAQGLAELYQELQRSFS